MSLAMSGVVFRNSDKTCSLQLSGITSVPLSSICWPLAVVAKDMNKMSAHILPIYLFGLDIWAQNDILLFLVLQARLRILYSGRNIGGIFIDVE